VLLVPPVIAASGMLWITAWGPGVWPDSIIYLDAARSVIAGRGVSAAAQPLVHYPPGYPLLLGATGLFVPDLLQAARWLHAVVFGVNTLLFSLIVFHATERSRVTALAAALLFAASAPLLRIHSLALSDAPFLTLVLASLLLLSIDHRQPRRATLIAASASVGLALLTRYAGLPLLAPWAGRLANARRDGRRWHDVIAAALVAIAPITIWIVRNLVVAGSATNRRAAVHLVTIPRLMGFAKALHDFFFPVALPHIVKGVVVAALLAGTAAAAAWIGPGVATRAESPGAVFAKYASGFAVVYALFAVVSVSFFDASTSLDSRIATPICVALAAALFTLATGGVLRWAAIAAFALSLVLNLQAAYGWAVDVRRNGQEYTSRQWRDSPTIAQVRALGSEVPIYSNDPFAISFLTSRPARMIPLEFEPTTALPNSIYDSELRTMCRDIDERGAVVAWFHAPEQYFRRTLADLEAVCTPDNLTPFADGTLYSDEHRR